MDIEKLQQDRFLRKDPNQSDRTKSAVYTASNPAPKRGDDMLRKVGRPKGSEEDDGAPNVLTGTVIISCFIQTTALPYRIEMQGNDLTFFDDTYDENGEVVGDTSRLIFTHASGKAGEKISQGFIMEKRASVYNTYDNVLSWFALPAREDAHNFMFIGRNASSTQEERNLHSVHFAINKDSSYVPAVPLNGVFEIEYSEDEVFKNRIFIGGASDIIFPSTGLTGYTSVIVGGDGGVSGLGYGVGTNINILLYLLSSTAISLGADLIPDTSGAYDIGAPGAKIGTLYGSVVACPLPTVENPLGILERIAPPVFVGDRGHYGTERKYFDDLTFPEELLFTDKKGRKEIEHTTMIGFLLQTVIELKQKVDLLENKVRGI